MFRFRKKEGPKYTQCLTHRTWLSRQVQEELLKQEAAETVRRVGQDRLWYDKYL